MDAMVAREAPEVGTEVDRGRKPRVYAALDLGTNNCRLLIARASRDGFQVIDSFSRVVRLGEGLLASGRLSDAAQDRAVAALWACSQKLRRREVTLARSVATEACRRAANGPAFIERVYRETGIALDVITSAEEARLAVLGCQALIDPCGGQALVFDIGGGSTELMLVDPCAPPGEDVLAWTSLPWGVISLAETEPGHFDTPPERLAAYERMHSRVSAAMARFRATSSALRAGGLQLVGTSGTVTTLAALHLGLPSYDRRQVDGCHVPVEGMRAVGLRLAAQSAAERAQAPTIGHDRADLIVAGCAILEAILATWPEERLRVADRGIREGILRTLIARDAV
jgi:exopolyphosphatase/guanosine-5'-triphosphate,3'-diphosphate pyrophosphatase